MVLWTLPFATFYTQNYFLPQKKSVQDLQVYINLPRCFTELSISLIIPRSYHSTCSSSCTPFKILQYSILPWILFSHLKYRFSGFTPIQLGKRSKKRAEKLHRKSRKLNINPFFWSLALWQTNQEEICVNRSKDFEVAKPGLHHLSKSQTYLEARTVLASWEAIFPWLEQKSK